MYFIVVWRVSAVGVRINVENGEDAKKAQSSKAS